MERTPTHVHLVLFFTRGMSLEGWRRAGILERELALYHELTARGVAVDFVTYGGAGEAAFGDCLGGIGVAPNRWGLGSNLYSLLAPLLHRRLLRRATVLKTNQLNGAWSGVIAKRLWGKKLVVRAGFPWSRNFAEVTPGRWKRALAVRLERSMCRAADRVVVATPAHARSLVDRYGLAPARVVVIPNFVDTDRFRPRPDVAREWGRVVFVGRLSAEKNLPALLDAVSALPDVRLALVGDGPMGGELERAARGQGLAVDFYGTVPHHALPELLNRAEVFVLPSLYEGQPKALLEAMACAVPVVGTDVPGIRDVVRHGETGRLCGTGPAEIAGAIREALADGQGSLRMAERARDWVVREHALERAIEREISLLAELAAT